MGILDRTRTIQAYGLTVAAADERAEQEFDRSPETRGELEHAYLTAAQALDTEGHPRRAYACLGLATVRRYQKGRRDDALAAFEAALTAAPDNNEILDAYLDYITYAVSAAALLAIVGRMPAPIRVQKLPDVVAVGQGTDRWGTMFLGGQRRFIEALPGLLEALEDRPAWAHC